MSVIFLDVDGVLNSERHMVRLDERHRQLGHTEPSRPKRATTCDCFKLYRQIDRVAVARLNRIVAATGAKIVVSSTWRKLFELPELLDILVEHGLVGEIIGATPDGHGEPALLERYGHPERLYRGYEIDYWLGQHPEVDRFVILDDGSDMAMHGNRLVQTDCEDGLLDEHVELAIRVLAWDGTGGSPLDAEAELRRPLIVSTRSAASEDARRDFDGFAADEELRRLRHALLEGQWRIAAELAANLDEYLCRGGAPPLAWLGPDHASGPPCMQGTATRFAGVLARASLLPAVEREEILTGYVSVAPAPASRPHSSWGMHCNNGNDGCLEELTLDRTTAVQTTDEEDYEDLNPAHAAAAVALGWRVYKSVWWCPTHVVAKHLVCKGCRSTCPDCSCAGGPRVDAVEGIEVTS